jgi:nitrile hydratase accessory protein
VFRHALARLGRATYFDNGYYGRWLAAAELMLTDSAVLAPVAVACSPGRTRWNPRCRNRAGRTTRRPGRVPWAPSSTAPRSRRVTPCGRRTSIRPVTPACPATSEQSAGLDLPAATEIVVRDSSSEVRWLVLPERPAGTAGLSEEELVPLVTRDALVGVAKVSAGGRGDRTAGSRRPRRADGELVFAEPWESRAFGMAVALHAAGAFGWDEFQAALTARIAAWEAGSGGAARSYYRCWLAALEDVLAGTLAPGEVTSRAEALAARPAGHGHPH